ncbi:MAG: hypothetical protein K0R25_899 [Rickettsiaceae bacterium]|jgi:hypothetical protein|nr:hypothetical protein [Rickettsiaceae bacterium]
MKSLRERKILKLRKVIKDDDLSTFKKMVTPENHKRIHEEYRLYESESPLSYAAHFGAMNIMEYLIYECSADIHYGENRVLKSALYADKVEVAEWLWGMIKPNMLEGAFRNIIFDSDCFRDGKPETRRWILSKSTPQICLKLLKDYHIIEDSDIDMMEWIFKNIDLESWEALLHANNNKVFLKAAKKGQIEMMEWLLNKVGEERKPEIVKLYQNLDFKFVRKSLPLFLYICALIPGDEWERQIFQYREYFAEEKQANSSPLEILLESPDIFKIIQLATNLISSPKLKERGFSPAGLIHMACQAGNIAEKEKDILARYKEVNNHLTTESALIVAEYLNPNARIMIRANEPDESLGKSLESFRELRGLISPVQPAAEVKINNATQLAGKRKDQCCNVS